MGWGGVGGSGGEWEKKSFVRASLSPSCHHTSCFELKEEKEEGNRVKGWQTDATLDNR